MTTCDVDDLMDWLAFEDMQAAEKFIKACIRTKFLREIPGQPGVYEISGNEKQIENRVTAEAKSKKGGEATRRRWEKIKAAKASSNGSSIATGIASSYSSGEPQPSSMQGNAMQGNAKHTQGNGTESRGVCADAPILGPEMFLDLWNFHCGSLPKVRSLNETRVTLITHRLAEQPNVAYWEDVIKRLASSEFCTGGGKAGWRASFDWLIEDDQNHTKVSDGNYDNNGAVPASPPLPRKPTPEEQARALGMRIVE